MAAVLFAGVILSSGFPLFVFAAEKTDTASPKGFCTTIDQLGRKVLDGIVVSETAYAKKVNDRQSALDKHLKARDATLHDQRFIWDSTRDQLYVRLAKEANIDAEKAAIAKFTAAVDAATALRRQSVDDAVSAFRTNVDAASAARRQKVNDTIAAFKQKTSEVFAKAKSDCASGQDPSHVRSAYAKDMKTAKDDFRFTIKALEKHDQSLRTLPAAEQSAIAAAVVHFKTSLKAAEDELRRAFVAK